MESYQLKSKIVENGKEFLIQTVNDSAGGFIKTNLFEGGELLDASVLPHIKDITDNEILRLVKNAHTEKKEELKYLLQSFNEVIKCGQPRMMYHLGTAMYHKKMYPEAAKLFETAIELKEDYHEAYFYLCRVYLIIGKIDKAVGCGEKAVALRGNYADYRNAMGEAFLAAKSCKRAMIEFEKAVESNIYYAEAYFNIALTYILNAVIKEDFEMSGNLSKKCKDLLKKAALIQPDYGNDPYYDGVDAFENSDFKRAFALLKKIRDDRKERIRLEKASYFSKFHLYTDWVSIEAVTERINYLVKEIAKNPDYVDLYYELGLCRLFEARYAWKKAIEQFEEVLKINKDLKKARRGLDLAQEHYLKLTDLVTDIAEKSGT